MLTTKNLLTRLTFSAGLGVAVIAGGAVAVGAAPPDPDDAFTTHPPFDHHVEGGIVAEEPTVDTEDDFSYPYLDLSEYFDADYSGFDPSPEGSDDPSAHVIPGLDLDIEPRFDVPDGEIPLPDDVIVLPEADPEVDPEIGPGPVVDIDPCLPVAACPTPESDIPEETPDETPEETPDETPDETPEETPDTEPVVPTNEGSLPYTGAGSLVLAGIGTAIAGVGFAAHRLSRRVKH